MRRTNLVFVVVSLLIAWCGATAQLSVLPPDRPCQGVTAKEPANVTLQRGTEVELVLLHHINAQHTPVGSTVYLGVAEDVVADGQVVIPRGRFVEGTVEEVVKQRPLGRPGSASLSVRSVVAVDGTELPLSADFTAHGRDRLKTTVKTAVVLVGPLYLFSRGRMANVEKGSRFIATVAEDREIGPPVLTPGADLLPEATIRTSAFLDSETMYLYLEKKSNLYPIQVWIESPDDRPLSDAEARSLSLVRVNDLVVPEPVEVRDLTAKQYDKDHDKVKERKVTFDTWKVLRYCDPGPCELGFRTELDDGSSFESIASLQMKVVKKNSGGQRQ